eukprot:COSAG01_NODE_46006_length_404_cov_0.695082_1_plen_117_part_10
MARRLTVGVSSGSQAAAAGFQVPYDIKPSPLGGVGLFAREFIAEGSLVWKTAPGVNCKGITETEVGAHLDSLATHEEKYYFALHRSAWPSIELRVGGACGEEKEHDAADGAARGAHA